MGIILNRTSHFAHRKAGLWRSSIVMHGQGLMIWQDSRGHERNKIMRIGNKLVWKRRYVMGSLRMNSECENICVLCKCSPKGLYFREIFLYPGKHDDPPNFSASDPMISYSMPNVPVGQTKLITHTSSSAY